MAFLHYRHLDGPDITLYRTRLLPRGHRWIEHIPPTESIANPSDIVLSRGLIRCYTYNDPSSH